MSQQKSPPANASPKASTSISISRSLLVKLKREARRDRRSLSAQLEILIEKELSQTSDR